MLFYLNITAMISIAVGWGSNVIMGSAGSVSLDKMLKTYVLRADLMKLSASDPFR